MRVKNLAFYYVPGLQFSASPAVYTVHAVQTRLLHVGLVYHIGCPREL